MKITADSFLNRAYTVQPPHHVSVMNLCDVGDRCRKKFKEIKTPQDVFRVRVDTSSSDTVEFYLYDKQSDFCVGYFEVADLEETPESLKRLVNSGVYLVTPHLSLDGEYKGKGHASMIYRSFLAGNRVFVTYSHTKDAKILWDSLSSKEPYVSFFFNTKTGKVVPESHTPAVVRVLGDKRNFHPDFLKQL